MTNHTPAEHAVALLRSSVLLISNFMLLSHLHLLFICRHHLGEDNGVPFERRNDYVNNDDRTLLKVYSS